AARCCLVGSASVAENSANALVRSNSAASASLSVALPLNISSRSSEVSDELVHVPCRSGVPHAVRGACHCASAAAATLAVANTAIAINSRWNIGAPPDRHDCAPSLLRVRGNCVENCQCRPAGGTTPSTPPARLSCGPLCVTAARAVP